MDPRALLETLAHARGFAAVRFAAVPARAPRLDALEAWLEACHHADMAWMDRGRGVRADPRVRLAGARTAVVLAVHHHHRRPPDPGGRTGLVARYAWGRDYHNLMGKRLQKLRRDLREAGIASWGGVDTAPIVERAWAEAAGLGFSGKNCVQILPGSTSWFFLAVLFVDVEIPSTPPLGDHCGTCRRCLDACPTGAFVGPHVLDANRCISYWTIEARGLPPIELRSRFGRWIFGCDVCQEVCPHNTNPADARDDDLLPRHAWLDCDELLRSPDAVLLKRFEGTPLRRPGAVGLKRNALLCLANLGDDAAVPTVRAALDHPSPVVRDAASWALGVLTGRQT